MAVDQGFSARFEVDDLAFDVTEGPSVHALLKVGGGHIAAGGGRDTVLMSFDTATFEAQAAGIPEGRFSAVVDDAILRLADQEV